MSSDSERLDEIERVITTLVLWLKEGHGVHGPMPDEVREWLKKHPGAMQG